MRYARFVVVAYAAMLAACASDYGGSVSGNGKDVLSPEERRLQTVESRLAVVQRRLDAANLGGMDEQNQHLRDDLRTLRGDVEKLRYDFDQSQQRSRDLEARLQRLEAGGAAATPPAPQAGGAAYPPPSSAPVTAAPAAQAQADSNSIPVVTPAQTPLAAGGTTLSQGNGPSPEEEAAYLGAFDALKNGKYDDAIKGFRAQLERWPSGRYADNALYWSGEAYYVKRDYKSALAAFQAVNQRFPQSAKGPDALLKSGLVQMDMGDQSSGRATLQKVIKTYPNSNAARLAQQRLEPGKK
ncbi:tol-pal system protein YbgF [Solimonas soli]|uniref:tol-pal system protein YbgF n=1 Tax=Solimonas soli TaxID=413479 RepID=UPI0004B8AEA8|nr:tol-pal system protein YbgF [Solimonas soli]